MPVGWLTWFTPRDDLDHVGGRRLSGRPHRGNRAKIKAARRAARRNR